MQLADELVNFRIRYCRLNIFVTVPEGYSVLKQHRVLLLMAELLEIRFQSGLVLQGVISVFLQ